MEVVSLARQYHWHWQWQSEFECRYVTGSSQHCTYHVIYINGGISCFTRARSALVLTPEQICQWGSARAALSNKVIANDRSARSNGKSADPETQKCTWMHGCWDAWLQGSRCECAPTGTDLAPIESWAFAIKQRNMGEKSQLFMMEMDKAAINLHPQMPDRLIEVQG